MDNNIKYIYRNKNGIDFRIKLERRFDIFFGTKITYYIQENILEPKNFWQRLKQFFTVKTYYTGDWSSQFSKSFNECLEDSMGYVLNDWSKEIKAEQMWANLK